MTVLMLLNIWVMLVRQARPSLALLSQHTIPVLPPHCLELACTKTERQKVQTWFENSMLFIYARRVLSKGTACRVCVYCSVHNAHVEWILGDYILMCVMCNVHVQCTLCMCIVHALHTSILWNPDCVAANLPAGLPLLLLLLSPGLVLVEQRLQPLPPLLWPAAPPTCPHCTKHQRQEEKDAESQHLSFSGDVKDSAAWWRRGGFQLPPGGTSCTSHSTGGEISSDKLIDK